MINKPRSARSFQHHPWCAAAVVSAFAAITSGAATDSWRPDCDETRTGQYVFEALGGSKEQPVRIYLCSDVRCATKSSFATVTNDSYSAPRPQGLARPYFQVERRAERRIIGARRLALEGAYNFRDLGGLQTQNGKTVRWGQVFRSDTLTRLTANDYQRLNAIGISLVCDLRTREERKTDPTEWQDGSPVFVLAPVSENDKGASQNDNLAEALRSSKMSVEEGKARFEQFYVRMVFDSASKFGAVLRAIETSGRPCFIAPEVGTAPESRRRCCSKPWEFRARPSFPISFFRPAIWTNVAPRHPLPPPNPKRSRRVFMPR